MTATRGYGVPRSVYGAALAPLVFVAIQVFVAHQSPWLFGVGIAFALLVLAALWALNWAAPRLGHAHRLRLWQAPVVWVPVLLVLLIAWFYVAVL